MRSRASKAKALGRFECVLIFFEFACMLLGTGFLALDMIS